jgi:hypothetical protein
VQTSSDLPPTEGYALHIVAYDDLCATDAAATAASGSDVANFAPKEASTPIDSAAVSDFLLHRQAVTRFVRDALQVAVDKQKENADRRGRKHMSSFWRGDRVLLSTGGIQGTAVTHLGANKLAPRFIGPFKILKVLSDAYTLDIPTAMRLRPTFYVGRLKPYVPATIPEPDSPRPQQARNRRSPNGDAGDESARALAPPATASQSAARHRRASPSDEGAASSRADPAPTESQQSPRARSLSEVLSLHCVVPRLVRLSNHHQILLDRQTLQSVGPLGATRNKNSLGIAATVLHRWLTRRARSAGLSSAWLSTIAA